MVRESGGAAIAHPVSPSDLLPAPNGAGPGAGPGRTGPEPGRA